MAAASSSDRKQGASDSAYAGAVATTRQLDPDRYLATLFAPATSRAPLFALYAFNAEIARIREIVSEPIPGEIRHQWWREALSCKCEDASCESPIAAALNETMRRFHLPPEPLMALIEARGFDLYDDPMPTWLDLEGYCGETSSTLIRLATIILADGEDPGSADTCGHAGVAYALTGLLRAFPIHARRQQCYVPHEVLIACGVSHEAIYEGRDSEGLRAALGAMRQRAREHLEAARAGLCTASPLIRPAFLPVCLCAHYLDAMDRPDYRPFETVIDLSPLRKLWILGRSAWRAKRC
ncbi:MAG: squalene/phytoene synthase family protein [Proteobacteria bacterium]|nr:squalene/phytoene synthase family protein [Pseudomonadota bacterium]